MKIISLLLIIIVLFSCKNGQSDEDDKVVNNHKIVGTWKLVYAETTENDSIEVRDMTKSDFIKIINNTHFAFFNQNIENPDLFYGAAGTYKILDNQYIEHLEYTAWDEYRNRDFPFTFEIKGDSLIQYGVEEIKESNIKKYILEKYIKIK